MKTGPKYKICRRLGDKVFSKCQTTKFTISGTNRKKQGKRRSNVSEYGTQLLEKQKAKYTYGLSEKQFSNYVKKVKKHQRKESSPTQELYQLLESRLDNIIFRSGLVNSRMFARQIVSHGHIMVNGRKVTIPSCKLKVGDKFSIRPQSKDKKLFSFFEDNKKDYQEPEWISFDSDKMEGEIKGNSVFADNISGLNLQSILEFYSRI